MQFVELRRAFVPVNRPREPSVDLDDIWSRALSGSLEWLQLLHYRRVVVLVQSRSCAAHGNSCNDWRRKNSRCQARHT
jgi:hypothetical protein